MIYVAQGHDVASLQPLSIELYVEEYPHYETEVSADGVARPIGGARAVLNAEALDYEEAIELLDQLGLSYSTPSAECTIRIKELHRIPVPFYGVVDLELYRSNGAWWEQFRLIFRRLVEA